MILIFIDIIEIITKRSKSIIFERKTSITWRTGEQLLFSISSNSKRFQNSSMHKMFDKVEEYKYGNTFIFFRLEKPTNKAIKE